VKYTPWISSLNPCPASIQLAFRAKVVFRK
jgi:hypothetical protein